MPSFIFQSDQLQRLDEAALLGLLKVADERTLLEDWAPLIHELPAVHERFVERFCAYCEAFQLISKFEEMGFLAADGVWLDSFYGQWIVAKMWSLQGQVDRAVDVYRDLLSEAPQVSFRLELEAARIGHKAGAFEFAFQTLSLAAQHAADYGQLQQAARLHARLERTADFPDLPVVRVALMLASAPQLIVPILRVMGFAYGLKLEVFLPDFDNVEQAIYGEQSPLFEFQPQVVILGSNYRCLDWDGSLKQPAAWATEQAQLIQQHWQVLSGKFNCRILQHTFDLPPYDAYGHLAGSLLAGRFRQLHALNSELVKSCPSYASIVDVTVIQARQGTQQWGDDRLWQVARQHPAPAAIPALVSEYIAILRAYGGQTKKVLVLDLDNTLWGGIVGEEGIAGIQVGLESPAAEAFHAFQEVLLQMKQRGVLLTVCSKNNESDAKRPFVEHDGMLLGLDDFVAFKANWESKDVNLQAIADELNLGLDSFVFVDDNPAERQLIREQLPEVTVVELPEEPAKYVATLLAGRWFEALVVSDEDHMRTQTYRQEQGREFARQAAPSLEGYLSGLKMRAQSGAFDLQRLERIAQLIQRTNQFNLTTRRHSLEFLRAMIDAPSYWTRWFSLSDRFGDHGITALVIVKIEGHVWTIDTLLMSCRVIGRGFEDYILNEVVAAALQAGAVRVEGHFVATAKNAQVADFYTDRQFSRNSEGEFSIAPDLYLPVRSVIL
ncbi:MULTISPECIES: HAD family hydrolase [unclassified Lentimonas]|uniref:HAD-IIIC family phosphatase n=1 Tax=unclassified Lentimonas TaxID=2630993 RepID=UPI001328912C|nr:MULTISPECIES: HAD-IIIC family phosphatase [unclassified Lentimonas]CAA6694165.1 Unannotated [Lentimonas sp. CC10]CAA6694336.1 Unannotated [Lentimonas sp. CC19]CAA7071091.1 Unannotated [Lentimonas sp. CC11]